MSEIVPILLRPSSPVFLWETTRDRFLNAISGRCTLLRRTPEGNGVALAFIGKLAAIVLIGRTLATFPVDCAAREFSGALRQHRPDGRRPCH
jgi:hypothetical protein